MRIGFWYLFNRLLLLGWDSFLISHFQQRQGRWRHRYLLSLSLWRGPFYASLPIHTLFSTLMSHQRGYNNSSKLKISSRVLRSCKISQTQMEATERSMVLATMQRLTNSTIPWQRSITMTSTSKSSLSSFPAARPTSRPTEWIMNSASWHIFTEILREKVYLSVNHFLGYFGW